MAKKPVFPDWGNINSEKKLVDLLQQVTHFFGFDGFVFAYAPLGWLPSNEPGDIHKVLHHGFNQQQIEGWLESTNILTGKESVYNRRFDPIRRYMVKQTLPKQFVMQDIIDGNNQQYSAVEKRWCQLLINQNIIKVLSVPVLMPPAQYWSLSFIAKKDNPELSVKELASLLFFAHGLVDVCIQSLHWREMGYKDSKVHLRKREKDCLYWAAQGKTARDTADILSLQPETVNKYLKNAMRRLNANSKTQAVVKALELGLLDLTSKK